MPTSPRAGWTTAVDHFGGLCSAIFAWPMNLSAANPFTLDVRLPIDDFRSAADLTDLRTPSAANVENANANWWRNKLDAEGFQAALPPRVTHLWDLYRTCRANLLILSDDGQIHPGPTIYDEFWIRDSSVEAIACALAGDTNLAYRQLTYWHPHAFNYSGGSDGVSFYGFFGREHEKNDREWDSNGQALWAFGRLDRIAGRTQNVGLGLFRPYIIEGARWIRNNRDQFGLLHRGWSAEHVGDKDKPHFWDDLWAVAGLWEAARLAERISAPETVEIWNIYNEVRDSTAKAIRYALQKQREMGFWETFIPTGPADLGRLDSTMIGILCYFHPCRLHDGAKLGPDIDLAARHSLDTIWNKFMSEGGFRHDSAWNAYGPYLTLQLAHCFLLIGDLARMDQCLGWSVRAGSEQVSRQNSAFRWNAVLGAWNEQHCYPVAKDFAWMPDRSWYMGDIPHGWACAEFMMLLRDILFFEVDEDRDPHIYLAPGMLPHWLDNGQSVQVTGAATSFNGTLSYQLTHDAAARQIRITNIQSPPGIRLVYPCPFGNTIQSATANLPGAATSGRNIFLPAGITTATIVYT